MTVELRLKRKYLTGGKGRYKSSAGGNNQAARQHRELTPAEKARHLAQPVKVMRLLPNGKVRMVTVER
jgi:hypothetical protein